MVFPVHILPNETEIPWNYKLYMNSWIFWMTSKRVLKSNIPLRFYFTINHDLLINYDSPSRCSQFIYSPTSLFPQTFHITFSSCGKFQAAKAATILWQQRTFWTIHLRFISCYFPLDICRSLHNQAARNLRAVPGSTIHSRSTTTPHHAPRLHTLSAF